MPCRPEPRRWPATVLARLPGLERIPWLRLGRFPTPVQEVHGLGVALWLKRDELSSPGPGLPGGNKVRKLEPLLGDALTRRARSVVSSGALGSSHLLACARYASWIGMEAICVAGPLPPSPGLEQRQAALLKSGARIIRVPSLALGPAVALALAAAGRHRCWIPPGGSGPRGVLGHVLAGLEFAGQVAAGECPEPGKIFVAAGSGGTLAGLLLGLRLGGLGRIPVIGVQVVPWPVLSPSLVAAECAAALRLLRRRCGPLPEDWCAPRPAEVILQREQLGPGYGWSTPDAERAVARIHQTCGLQLETTYTGKALAAALACAETRPPGDPPVLFWNTFDALAVSPTGL